MRYLLDPFLVLFVLTGFGLALLWYRRSISRRRLLPVTLAFAGLTVVCTPVFCFFALGSLEWRYPPDESLPTDVEAVVVLGGSLRPLDEDWSRVELAEDSMYRCLAAARLYQRLDGSCLVVVSGGKVDQERPGPTIAAAMRDVLLLCGVASQDLIVEGRSSTTYENALETSKLLKERGISKVILVTDAIHLLRAERCFVAQGVEVVPYGTVYRAGRFKWSLSAFLPSASAARQVRRVVHEWVGMAWYRLRGRI